MYRRTERPSADRRGCSGPTNSLVPAVGNVKRPQTAPAEQLRRWRKMRNFSFWKPSKFAFGVLDADDYIIQSDAVVHEVTIRPKNFRSWTQCGSLCCIAAKPRISFRTFMAPAAES